MAGKNNKSVILFTLWLVFILISCKTSPGVLDSDAQFLSLDSGAVVYVVADAKKARPVIDLLPLKELENKQIKQMIDKTNFFMAAVFPQESGRSFQIASLGNYPSFGAGIAFTFNSQWKKLKEGRVSYWYSKSNGVSLLLDSKKAFAASANIPVNPAALKTEVKIPEGFNDFAKEASFSCWLNNPAGFFNGILDSAGIPLQFSVKNVFANIFPAGRRNCQAVIRLQFENPTHARGMMALLNMAGAFSSGDMPFASIFFANPPVVNGSNLDIKTALLNEADLAGLFKLF